jgi:hypothetical protein
VSGSDFHGLYVLLWLLPVCGERSGWTALVPQTQPPITAWQQPVLRPHQTDQHKTPLARASFNCSMGPKSSPRIAFDLHEPEYPRLRPWKFRHARRSCVHWECPGPLRRQNNLFESPIDLDPSRQARCGEMESRNPSRTAWRLRPLIDKRRSFWTAGGSKRTNPFTRRQTVAGDRRLLGSGVVRAERRVTLPLESGVLSPC